jgi:hypothetical protein
MVCLAVVVIMLIIMRCLPMTAQADPIGPPTIETYLQNIHSGMVVIKYVLGAVGFLFFSLIGVITYAYKRDIAEVKEDAKEAKKNAGDAFKEINNVKREFLSKEGHDRGCPHRNPTIEAGH